MAIYFSGNKKEDWYATTCTTGYSSGNYGWCPGNGHEDLSHSFGCSGNTIGYGWSGYSSLSEDCDRSSRICADRCGELGATCYTGAGNGNYVSCRCTDGGVTVNSLSGYDYAGPCEQPA